MIPIARKSSEMINQKTPQQAEEPPYLFAKTLASDLTISTATQSASIS